MAYRFKAPPQRAHLGTGEHAKATALTGELLPQYATQALNELLRSAGIAQCQPQQLAAPVQPRCPAAVDWWRRAVPDCSAARPPADPHGGDDLLQSITERRWIVITSSRDEQAELARRTRLITVTRAQHDQHCPVGPES